MNKKHKIKYLPEKKIEKVTWQAQKFMWLMQKEPNKSNKDSNNLRTKMLYLKHVRPS